MPPPNYFNPWIFHLHHPGYPARMVQVDLTETLTQRLRDKDEDAWAIVLAQVHELAEEQALEQTPYSLP